LLPGAAVFERLQRLDESSESPMREELDTLLIGVIVSFMYGWFGPVRPGALISLCHPGYQVHPQLMRILLASTKQMWSLISDP